MNFVRFLKTVFLIEFISGLYLAIKEFLKNQKLLIILLKKAQ